MKRSKKFLVRFLLKYSKRYFPEKIYSFILFIRGFKKFKKQINKEKSFKKFSNGLDRINEHEYKITSQNNEDGIIEYIFDKIPNQKYFVEIGFGYFECNSLNLIKNGWRGKLIDYSTEECLLIKSMLKHFFSNSEVAVENKKIDRDNINQILSENLQERTIDFFSLDIDGNDYWVLKNLKLDNIKVICCEYNHWIGNDVKKTIPYNPNHEYKHDEHKQIGYFGATLLAIYDLLKKKGFDLIAVESSGSNAFFVKKEFSNNFEILSPIKSWRSASRHENETQIKMIKNNMKKLKFEDV